MSHLKIKYTEFINEAMTINIDELLKSINAKKISFHELKLSRDKYTGKDIEFLYNDNDFNKQLYEDNLKKSELLSSEEAENFLKGNINIKFFLLSNRNDSKLDNPEYIVVQYNEFGKANDIENEWSEIEIYDVKNSINNFFETLTAKTIKLTQNGKNFTYQTSNSGNNWILVNKIDKNQNYKDSLEYNEIRELIKNGAKIKVID